MLTLIAGPMFSGKTDLLIRMLNGYERTGDTVLTLQAPLNTRDGPNEIVSRCGSRRIATVATAQHLDSLFVNPDPTVVGIDEAHLFGGLTPMLKKAIWDAGSTERGWNKHLIVCGLGQDSEGNPFPWFENINGGNRHVLKATCELCGSEADWTFFDGKKAGQVLVGDRGYSPRCWSCWSWGQAKKRKASR